jgi:hypothetical protein
MRNMVVFDFNTLYIHLSQKFNIEYDEVQKWFEGYDAEEGESIQGVVYGRIPRDGYVSISVGTNHHYLYSDTEFQKKFVAELRELSQVDEEKGVVLINFY